MTWNSLFSEKEVREPSEEVKSRSSGVRFLIAKPSPDESLNVGLPITAAENKLD